MLLVTVSSKISTHLRVLSGTFDGASNILPVMTNPSDSNFATEVSTGRGRQKTSKYQKSCCFSLTLGIFLSFLTGDDEMWFKLTEELFASAMH